MFSIKFLSIPFSTFIEESLVNDKAYSLVLDKLRFTMQNRSLKKLFLGNMFLQK